MEIEKYSRSQRKKIIREIINRILNINDEKSFIEGIINICREYDIDPYHIELWKNEYYNGKIKDFFLSADEFTEKDKELYECYISRRFKRIN
jgi:hypothetical protein